MYRNWRIGILAMVVVLGIAIIAFGGIQWFWMCDEPGVDFEVKPGGPITLIIHNDTPGSLYYMYVQFTFPAYERIAAINCLAFGPGRIEKIELGHTLGIYFVKGEEFAPGSRLFCSLALKGGTEEEYLSYIADPGKLVYRARGLQLLEQ